MKEYFVYPKTPPFILNEHNEAMKMKMKMRDKKKYKEKKGNLT